VQNFMKGADSIQDALANFVRAVKSGEYPQEEHTYS
jgi:3-methyl-2-oxobutanoate hydroxymethyltransferase